MSLKNRSQFSSTLDNELYDKLKEFSSYSKIPISKLLDSAVYLFLREAKQLRKLEEDKIKEEDEKYIIHINLPND